MIHSPKITLYLYFDSKITQVRAALEQKFYFLAHQKLQNITDEDIEYLLVLVHELETLEVVIMYNCAPLNYTKYLFCIIRGRAF